MDCVCVWAIYGVGRPVDGVGGARYGARSSQIAGRGIHALVGCGEGGSNGLDRVRPFRSSLKAGEGAVELSCARQLLLLPLVVCSCVGIGGPQQPPASWQ